MTLLLWTRFKYVTDFRKVAVIYETRREGLLVDLADCLFYVDNPHDFLIWHPSGETDSIY